jgi:hypothetical protein
MLLGPHHDGKLELTYRNVHSYSFVSHRGFRIDRNEEKGVYFHGDWLTDEVRLSENDLVIHEIEWEHADWLIECKDIEAKWKPFEHNERN